MIIDSVKPIVKYQNHSKRMRVKLVRGFTLVEIIIVIAIMAVLTAVVYSSFDASKAQSRDRQRVSDISVIQLALEQYFNKNGVYPVTLGELKNPDRTTGKAYLSEIPQGPTAADEYSSSYFPITKTKDSDKCISYQLWTQFERNNSYLNSKKGFDSVHLPTSFFECVGEDNTTHNSISASSPENTLVYDVMP